MYKTAKKFMTSTKIIIAVPRGRIIEDCKYILNKTSFSPDSLLFDDNCRKLTFSSSDPNIDFIKKIKNFLFS